MFYRRFRGPCILKYFKMTLCNNNPYINLMLTVESTFSDRLDYWANRKDVAPVVVNVAVMSRM